MKIVLIVVGAAAGTLLLIFLVACIAVVRAGKCMKAMEEM